MSDIYADDNLDVVQGNEIGEPRVSLHAPDAHRLAVVHHHDADYGLPETTVTIAEDSSGATLSCSHGGVSYASGETAVVPLAVARFWVRSGWATTDSDDVEDDADAADETPEDGQRTPSVDPPVKASSRSVLAAGTGRRKR